MSMTEPLKIAMIASECVPFAKTGGLADVVGALPKTLSKMGHDVIVILPLYTSINYQKYGLERYFETLGVWMGDTQEWCSVHTTTRSEGVRVFFIEFNKYFDRDGVYNDKQFRDYPDNPRRFAFLTRAGLQLCRDLPFEADILHVHDWQTALGSAYLKVWHWNDAVLGRTASVLSIHNVSYQGVYSSDHFPYIGLQWWNFTHDKLEDHGRINFLKGGIQYADMITTVSPTYARETRTAELGMGMGKYLYERGDDYVGILNGVDYTEWNPEIDTLIPATYSVDAMEGKVSCKRELQKRFKLDIDSNIPLLGIVSRFANQKGLQLFAEVIQQVIENMAVQIVILGSGDPSLETFYDELPKRYPGRVGSFIGYNNQLAHWIEAGSDFFIMPSFYEPCGLNQIYSLKYGTLPIVRATGGLDDTVEQYQESTGAGTGFKFWAATAHAVYYTVGWAISTYFDRREHFLAMRRRAMQRTFSWEASAKKYEQVYNRALQKKRGIR